LANCTYKFATPSNNYTWGFKMFQAKRWALTGVVISLTAGCASQIKTEVDAATQALQSTHATHAAQVSQSLQTVQAAQAAQSAQAQKALDDLNQQVKSQSDVLKAALAKAVPDHGAAQRLEAAKEAEKRKMVEVNISNAPEWFLRDESGPDAIYVTATEGSVDMQLSIDMAMLSAKRLLTNSLGEVISSRMTEFASQTTSGDDLILNKEIERVTKSMIAEVMLNGYTRDRIQVIPNGKEYQTYVRLRYPTDELKKVLAKEIKKNNIMAAKVRKTKAFEELEKEIEAAREQKAANQAGNGESK
jgi:hypothetical protein